MRILVTGSAGHLGEALVRSYRMSGKKVFGLDIKASEFTDWVGSVTDSEFINQCVGQCSVIIHTATLHKPHIGTHTRQDFVDTNITGTLNLLEAATAHNCSAFIYTSTTSTFGDAMRPEPGQAAVWVREGLVPKPKNIYGVTKIAAEDLCALFYRNTGLPCIVLKTSRFFPEQDDAIESRQLYEQKNLKVNELLYRRVDIADIVTAHTLAMAKASDIGFDRFIISSTPPFTASDARELGVDAAAVVAKYVPQYRDEYARRNWRMLPTLDRVYDNTHARSTLGWEPEFTFEKAIDLLSHNKDYRSELSKTVGSKGYHLVEFEDSPYPLKGF